MSIFSWIKGSSFKGEEFKTFQQDEMKQQPKPFWTRCENCGIILYHKHLRENQYVCFSCDYHLTMNSQERIENLLDENTWVPLDSFLSPINPLNFYDHKSYTERLGKAQEKTGLQDAIQTGIGKLDGIPVALGIFDFDFLGGTIGSVVGEKLVRLIDYAAKKGLTLIIISSSGGVRVQEGALSLFQMAKINAALQKYQDSSKLLYISILTSPTTGGASASFAFLGDFIIAEPNALIGFAGRKIIEQKMKGPLPKDFQTAKYFLEKGFIDLIIPRTFLRQAISEILSLHFNSIKLFKSG